MKKLFSVLGLVGLSFLVATTPTATAVTARDWQAGNIMDDGVFTDSNAMSVAQIQSWLNARLKNCDYRGTAISELSGGRDYNGDGRVTRAEYGQTKGNPAPFTCLDRYYEVPKTTPNRSVPASNYGSSTIPRGAKSAAQLIYDAGRAYNISPKVLLVKLATESAGPLTSDTWPLKSQYTYAMGARCPDSGPNGTANCDPNYSGFSIQMREAAALMRWYLDNMSQSWWSYKKPRQTNHILWNVEQSNCGGSNVYIQNKATAALYTYTPYQPNRAALSNMYGTGDRCSAYGNRNFWRVFSDWFGSTRIYTKGSIKAKHDSLGGSNGRLGSPLANEQCGLRSNGCYQKFEKGSIYISPRTSAQVVTGAIRTKWSSAGYESGWLGYPVMDEQCGLKDNGCFQRFQHGSIYISTSSNGAHAIGGAIRSKWHSEGYENGDLGYPTGDERCGLSSSGCYQSFQSGSIYISRTSGGAHKVNGAIRAKWSSIGFEAGPIGYPTMDEQCDLKDGGCFQRYQHGSIYISRTSGGAHVIGGAIRNLWHSEGYENGDLGYPTGDEQKSGRSIDQRFQGGIIRHTPGSGTRIL